MIHLYHDKLNVHLSSDDDICYDDHQIRLNDGHSHLVPGHRLQDGQLRALDVETEEVHLVGDVSGQKKTVQGVTLNLFPGPELLGDTVPNLRSGKYLIMVNVRHSYPLKILVVHILQVHVNAAKHVCTVKLHNIGMREDGETGVNTVSLKSRIN